MLSREALAAALEELDTEVQRSLSADSVVALAAAARELLAGQKVWWCLEHQVTGPDDVLCEAALFNSNFGPEDGPCRMVEAVLVIPE